MTAAIEFESREVGRSHIDSGDLALLARHTGLTEDECLARLRDYRFSELADAWRRRGPSTPEEIRRFYGETDLYLWELLAWNGSREYAGYLDLLERLARRWPPERHPRALDFGSGVGTAALRLATLGYEVTIADVPGRTFVFAQERLRRHGVQFEALAAEGELPSDSFDVLVCFDVLEHVPQPRAVARRLVRALKRGGGAAVVASFDTQGDAWPHHLPDTAAPFRGHRWRLHLQRLGLALVDDSLYTRVGRARELGHCVQHALWRSTGIYVQKVER